MPLHIGHEGSEAPVGFTPQVLRGPFFAGRTVHVGGDSADRFAVQTGEDDRNGLGFVHGGVIATLADIFLVGFIARRVPDAAHVVTASLSVDFLAPCRAGDWLSGVIHAHRIGRRQCVAAGEFRVGDQPVALIRAHCSVLHHSRSQP